ncbi:glycosyltransferase [Ochrovirga pacifica]|uniref:glycosyltransferase n=1 Tax=Ochrovirga pacifica TaxID=1042376 RepID=UPI0002559DFA|nr:glycosyltransferase [Ochrovirga pacifica]
MMCVNKPKALVFFQYLPPWRIDVFNEMAKYYQLTIVYTNAEVEGFQYDREDLLGRLDNSITNIFLNNGFKIGKRPIRFGLYKIINSVKPDIVFSHEYSPTSIAVAMIKKLKLLNYQYVITTSDNLAIARGVKGVKGLFRRYVLSIAGSVIVYSEAVKKFYEQTFPKLEVGICPNIQSPQSLLNYKRSFQETVEGYKERFNLKDQKIVLYTGRLKQHIKGLDLLLEAFAKSENENYKLVLVGTGHDKDALENQCASLHIKDKVIFAGFYSGKDLYAWYHIADFYVLPSRYEPFGAVVNEALVFGCPVLGSKYIGALDFITDQNGKIFDPLESEEFVESLNYMYSNSHDKNEDKKENLMPVSFEQYVKVFYSVYNS